MSSKIIANAANYLQKVNQAQLKNTECKYCGKTVDPDAAVFVDGITCGNTTYPGGGVFCSNKCRFDYEKGYYRNQ